MMRPQPKKRHRSRTSRRFCEEKFCCPDPETEAAYFCQDCKSAQCQQCEKSIHSSKAKYDFHDRRTIEPPPASSLCHADSVSLRCKDRNFADLWCQNCNLAFCFDCYNDHHKNRKLQHINVSFAHHEKIQREKAIAEATALSEVASVKPISPLSLNDDSLTYCSFPQQTFLEEFHTGNMSFSSAHSDNSNHSMPDLWPEADTNQLTNKLDEASLDDSIYDDARVASLNKGLLAPSSVKSFLLVNDQEKMQVKDEKEFIGKLGCPEDAKVKVVSIFGNTGDGKSHTLNHTFFGRQEVFQTSALQTSCTMGVWAAFDGQNNVIVIDTEGLLGSSANDNRRTRLLLKVLATSDVVIFRTRAERLHVDMFVFLSNASKAYKKHFSEELKAASQRYNIKESNLGPTLIVFQETSHTEPLKGEKNRRPDAVLRDMFAQHDYSVDAFNDICYWGIKTVHPPTDFTTFRNLLLSKIRDNSIRAARSPSVMFQSLKALNEKFNGEIETVQLNTFPEKYFTCSACCLACQSKCMKTMNHNIEREPHDAGRDRNCHYHHQYGNKVYLCKMCAMKGKKTVVVPKTSSSSDSSWVGLTKYIWSGYILECPSCGIIYRSREHWFGNQDPESVVQVEVRHLWPEGIRLLQGTHNAAQKVLDGFSYVAETISSIGARPTKLISEWTADQLAPAYWVPNSQILKCGKCGTLFTTNEQKHHCRACGKGFCDECTTKKRPVPERGWGLEPVRVCDTCYEGNSPGRWEGNEETVTARKVGEVVSSTIGVIASAFDYPLVVLKDSARPEYWIPDDQIKACIACAKEFGPKLPIHHCRACGMGVCDECSQARRQVPMRGWDYPVRVCKKCENKSDEI